MYWSLDYIHLSCFVFRSGAYELLLDRMVDDTSLEFSLACYGKWRFSPEISFVYYQRKESIMHRADDIELCLLEMLQYQDILNYKYKKKWLMIASLSRYYNPFLQLIKNRSKLCQLEYSKYVKCSKQKENDIISEILRNDNGIYISLKLIKLFIANLIIRAFRKITIYNKINKY